jgi:hypothetical protein
VIKDENNKIVDTLTTDQNGGGMSKPLPFGHYVIWETQAPTGYRLNKEPEYADISDDGAIIDLVVTNKPLEWGLTVSKTGSYEVQAGDSFYYAIDHVANTSNAAISQFNWIDSFPVHAARLQKVETGVYNAQVNLTVGFKTNYSGEWQDWGSNIDTTQNAELNFGNILGQDEYITELKFDFGTVSAGFRSIEETRLYATALPTLENGQSFTNNIHMSGQTSEGTAIHVYDMWTTKIWKLVKWSPQGKLPQTGN